MACHFTGRENINMNYSITGFCVLYSDYCPYDLALHTFIRLGMVQFDLKYGYACICLAQQNPGWYFEHKFGYASIHLAQHGTICHLQLKFQTTPYT